MSFRRESLDKFLMFLFVGVSPYMYLQVSTYMNIIGFPPLLDLQVVEHLCLLYNI